MPKSRRGRKMPAKKNAGGQRAQTARSLDVQMQSSTATVAASSQRALRRQAAPGPQNIIFSAMVALGCWGMALTFAYFSKDPNHLLYAGMAVLMGLLWSFLFMMRARKMLAQRQSRSASRG